MIRIREARPMDREAIRDVHLAAFPEGEGPLVSALASNLLREATSPKTIALVAEVGGAVVGHIAFSPVTVGDLEDWSGYILAPLGVKPEHRRRGIGTRLIESGIARLAELGANVLFVYGDPGYYRQHGFQADAASGYLPPHELKYPFGWQALVMREAVFGMATVQLSCVASLDDPRLW